ncbi:hypothetical protein PICMEDRAFT_105663 [Pichia membranifaciens NRRL Y-2026]|uniref:Uncharacterized protein n=1 Tax=Pichia membranifaciens NRRL Y-2026 TaxID=763406 RepID=A0A1E3NLN5_9ASCO|nr:hypothetical protein PICMEDRAFT_105663 [Pichia membranifaciens NRRL Y-2026]ODQ47047.1 hypothetical protein PICMEDRAFT_105663 [Pichia membranifaciens NRRL Y-2026]
MHAHVQTYSSAKFTSHTFPFRIACCNLPNPIPTSLRRIPPSESFYVATHTFSTVSPLPACSLGSETRQYLNMKHL